MSSSHAMVNLTIPQPLPILPLPPNQVLFPSLVISISLHQRSSINLLRAVIRDVEIAPGNKPALIGVVPLRNPGDIEGRGRIELPPSKDESGEREKGLQVIRLPKEESSDTNRPTVDDLYEWACAARILRVERLASGGYIAVVEGLARIRIDRYTQVGYPFFEAEVTVFAEQGLPVTASNRVNELKAIAHSLLETFTSLRLPLPPLITKRINALIVNVSLSSAGGLADVLISTLVPSHSDKLTILSTTGAEDRVVKTLEILSRINEEARATKRIGERVEGNLSRRQREYFLRQQLEAINQELKELDGKGAGNNGIGGLLNGPGNDNEEDELKELEKRIEVAQMPPEALTQAKRELKRLKRIPSQSVEHGVIRNYLDWMCDMPWGRGTTNTLDRSFLDRAKKQLDDDHFGLDKVKRRLLEYLAVIRLRAENEAAAEHQAATARQADDANRNDVAILRDTLSGQDAQVNGLHSPTPPFTGKDEPAPHPVSEQNPVPHPGRNKGPIILLVGPPGVGKTSIARSLATAMGRKFHRISLGGVRDEAEIRGHRRTYVGAMPGLICQGLRKVGVNNPVFLLDEIDKISSNNFHGDPAAALLEVLDPEQNHAFNDHYINCGVDLSQVLFIATANTLESISAPLMDRMEVIQLSGYVYDEKAHIARRYLLPKQLTANALESDQVQLTDEALMKIITSYTFEAGVRTLERQIGAICRAKAVEFAESRDEPVGAASPTATEPTTMAATEPAAENPVSSKASPSSGYNPAVDVADVEKYLGPETHEAEVSDAEGRPGVATGMAYSGSGNGGILHVESTSFPGPRGGALRTTGRLGDVIAESANLALSWVRAHAYELALVSRRGEDVLSGREIHLHLPSGAVRKDGPSAGVAMVVSLVSLLSGIAVDPRLAMTGEITLRGMVQPVGGIKEKVLSAHRAGVRTIILPERNRKDTNDLPARVKSEVKFVYVRTIMEVLEAAFGDKLWSSVSDRAEDDRQDRDRRRAAEMVQSRL